MSWCLWRTPYPADFLNHTSIYSSSRVGPPEIYRMECHIWPSKPPHPSSQMKWKPRTEEKVGGVNRKKDLFQLQTNPPGEILFQCTLHFVALMPALNCFGTCHKYWWNSCSLQNTFPFILLTFPSISLFFSRHASHLFPRSLLHSVWAAVWSCIWEIKSLVHYDFLQHDIHELLQHWFTCCWLALSL